MRLADPPLWRGGGKAMVAACIAAMVAVLPMTVSAATRSWTIVSSPNPSNADAALGDVTCIGASDCWAVGQDSHSGKTLIEHNSGSGWVIVTSPNPTDNPGGSQLAGVTCVGTADCWAVGDNLPSSGIYQTLIEHYNGSNWNIVPSPNPGTDYSRLVHVKCIAAGNCWAVGTYATSGIANTLLEHYTLGSWVVVANSLSDAFLQDLACLRLSGDCWAVGFRFDSSCAASRHQCTLIEHNVGQGWVVVPSPNKPNADNHSLNGVTCMSASNCWAVGSYYDTILAKTRTLTEHYDGTGWSLISSPNIGSSSSNELVDVSCGSATDCWAVGIHTCCAADRTLIEHNKGSGWVVVKSPNASLEINELFAVKCLSPRNCWAVGWYVQPTVGGRTLVEHYG